MTLFQIITRFYHSLREPVSGLTHLAGALLSVFGLVLLIHRGLMAESSIVFSALTIFGITLILLYTASSLYHLLPLSEDGVRLLRKFDHMMIYVLIAGTYTPISLIILDGLFGWSLFIVMWSLTAIGIVFKTFWFQAPKWISLVMYIGMGWLGLLAFPTLMDTLPLAALIWILMGGLAYTVGAVIYGLKKPDPLPRVFGFHEIWHLFVMAGSFCHFWVVYAYVA